MAELCFNLLPSVAIAKLVEVLGDKNRAEEEFIRALYAGDLCAEGAPETRDSETDLVLGKALTRSVIPHTFWRRFANEQGRAIWPTSTFQLPAEEDLLSVPVFPTTYLNTRIERQMFEWLLHQMEDSAAKTPASPAPTPDDAAPPARRGGNPGKVELWHRFWLEAMTMLDLGQLDDRARFPTQRSLMDELRARIDDGLSEESIKPLVSRIWLRFVTREG